MQLNKIKPFALSLVIHVAIIVLIFGIALPEQQHIDEQPSLKSYLYIKPPVIESSIIEPTTVKPEHVNTVSPVEEANEIEKTTTVQNQPVPETVPIEIVDEQPKKNAQAEQASLQNNATTNVNQTSTILNSTAKFITDLNSKKLNELSQHSAQAYRQPKPLIDKSKEHSINAQLKAQSADFAPPGSNIIVLSEFEPNETTIMVEDSCMTVTETDLLDPVTRGATLWRFGGAGCQKYDKFNGQLQKSLDKYLKK
ncbi:cell envelope integrity protein TolA [Glaciecola sp. 1036]|uniref:cell envelope integrity protein TolA n=1 Tax=Alteromonadaceae TaxID=72275 RepID=UPI003CFD0024